MKKSFSTATAVALAVLLGACESHDRGAPPTSAAGEAAAGAASAESQAAGAAAAPAPQPSRPGEVRRISIDDARNALADGTAVIYDVRGEAAYDARHIEGAKPLPGDEIDQRLAELPKDKLIITYCA